MATDPKTDMYVRKLKGCRAHGPINRQVQKMTGKTVNTLFFLFVSLQTFSQQEKSEKEESSKGNHRITTGLGHTHLAKGKNVDGETVWLAVPSWSLNYDYWISSKWAIGLQNDIVIEKFIVEDEGGQDLERENPVAVVPVGIFKPWQHLSFIVGGGIEFEKEENLGLSRLGIEYGCELSKGWEAGIAAMWDAKWGHYDSWVLEFSFSKIFRRKVK